MLWSNWAGFHPTGTPLNSARLVVDADTDGVLSVVINGSEVFGSTIATAVNGIGYVDVAGLSANTTYPYTVNIGGVAQSRRDGKTTFQAKTLRSSSCRLMSGSCVAIGREHVWMSVAAENDPDVMFIQDDFPYTDLTVGSDYFTDTITTSNTLPNDVQNYLLHHRRERTKIGFLKLVDTGCRITYMPGDHEKPDDNWPNEGFASLTDLDVPLTNQAEMDAIAWAADQASIAYMTGNPTNSNVLAVAEKPDYADAATPVSQYPVKYFDWKIDGLVHFTQLDTITYRSLINATDGPSKVCIGDNQMAWVESVGQTATAPFNVFGVPIYMFPLASEDAAMDRYDKYPTERATLLDTIKAEFDNCVTFHHGDRHVTNVWGVRRTEGDAWDYDGWVHCPSGVSQGAAAHTYGANTSDIRGTADNDNDIVVGQIDITPTQKKVKIIRVLDNQQKRDNGWISRYYQSNSNIGKGTAETVTMPDYIGYDYTAIGDIAGPFETMSDGLARSADSRDTYLVPAGKTIDQAGVYGVSANSTSRKGVNLHLYTTKDDPLNAGSFQPDVFIMSIDPGNLITPASGGDDAANAAVVTFDLSFPLGDYAGQRLTVVETQGDSPDFAVGSWKGGYVDGADAPNRSYTNSNVDAGDDPDIQDINPFLDNGGAGIGSSAQRRWLFGFRVVDADGSVPTLTTPYSIGTNSGPLFTATSSDTTATVEAAGFLNNRAGWASLLKTNDVVLIEASDGAKYYTVTVDKQARIITLSTGLAIT